MSGFLASAAAWLTGSKYGPWVLLAIALLTAGLIYRSQLIQKGLEDAERQAEEATRERRDEQDRIEREVESLTPTELDQKGEPWVRR